MDLSTAKSTVSRHVKVLKLAISLKKLSWQVSLMFLNVIIYCRYFIWPYGTVIIYFVSSDVDEILFVLLSWYSYAIWIWWFFLSTLGTKLYISSPIKAISWWLLVVGDVLYNYTSTEYQ